MERVFQSTHPRRVRLHMARGAMSSVHFNPRTREGCDGFRPRMVPHDCRISIHAPAKGATDALGDSVAELDISIHAPAKGATKLHRIQRQRLHNFNPRTREGCDGTASSNASLALQFQSTHPRRVRHLLFMLFY